MSWDFYAQQLEKIELSDSQRQRGRSAITFFREFLGENFLRRGPANGHPIFLELLNSAPMARLRLFRLAETLQSVKGFAGFQDIEKRLRNARYPDGFLEASSLASLARRFHQVGFTVTFEPSVEVTTTAGDVTIKKPDLGLTTDQKEQIFVEITRVRQSDAQRESRIVFDTVWFAVHGIMDSSLVIEVDRTRNRQINHHVLPYANIKPGLHIDDLPEVVEKIKDLGVRVEKTGSFQEIVIDDKLELAASPREDHSEVERWAESRGLRDIVEAPPLVMNELARLNRTIFEKTKQLPKDVAGIIVVSTTETLMMYFYESQAIIRTLQDHLADLPNIYGICLTLEVCSTPLKEPVAAECEDYLLVKQTREDQITETVLFVKNREFGLTLSPYMKQSIQQMFVAY